MNCPVCNRIFIASLSVCPSCGAMAHDSVREELILKKSSIVKPNKTEIQGKSLMPEKPNLKPLSKPFFETPKTRAENKRPNETVINSKERMPVQKSVTSELNVKPTSSTLLEFQSKDNAIPEWRLELKNAVRQKLKSNQQTNADQELFPTPRVLNRSVGATALKTEYVEDVEEQPFLHENEKVQNALLRIEKSRQRFFAGAETEVIEDVEPQAKKDFPYYIASRSNDVTALKSEVNTPNYTVTKPKLISSIPAENFKRDTNKLPPLPKPAKVATSFDKKIEPEIKDDILLRAEPVESVSILPGIIITPQRNDDDDLEIETDETVIEVNEDLAPFSMRFNAGLFDLIIGGFTSLIMLSPFILLGGNWFTTAGLLAFLATCSIVLFIYMTSAVGMFGKTFGMKMFALEIIDIEENDYPTFHQAAVSAAVYLLSLALGGSGFLTVLFTDEKRAVHDIVSGTVIVKDYKEETA